MESEKVFHKFKSIDRFAVNHREFLVYVAILLYCTAFFLTRVRIPLSQSIIYKTMFLGAFLALLNVFFDNKFTKKQIFLSLFLGIIILLDALPIRNYEILTLYIIIWGCRGINYEKIIKFILKIVIIMTIATMFLTFCGIVEGNVHVTNFVRTRYDFGYGAWTILPFQYLSLAMMLLYVKKRKANLWNIIILIAIGFVICDWADVKSAKLLLVIGLFGLYACNYIKIKKWQNLKFLILLPELLALISFIATTIYKNTDLEIIQKINSILNNRLMYAAIGLEKYGISLLSNTTFKTIHASDGYFGIDNCYLYLLVAWGIIGLIIIMFIYSYIIHYCIKTENLKLLFITLIMVMNAIMWNRLLVLIEMEMLICFADIFKQKKVTKMGVYRRKRLV